MSGEGHLAMDGGIMTHQPAVSEDWLERELALLYNYRPTDERQFTRHQMLVAIRHGYRAALTASANPQEGVVEDVVERVRQILAAVLPRRDNTAGNRERIAREILAALSAMRPAQQDATLLPSSLTGDQGE